MGGIEGTEPARAGHTGVFTKMSDQNRDLYRWSEGQDARYDTRQGDSQVTTRFRDEVYDQRMAQPRQFSYQGRDGNVNNIIVYGDVYINQGGDNIRTRYDGRQEYYGQQYDYSRYCSPCQQRQAVPYYEYGYRVSGGQSGYERSGWERQGGYDYGYRQGRPQVYQDYRQYDDYSYRQPVYRQQAPTYSRDSVSGGRGGYSADRERYNGGYTTNGGYDGGYSDWDRAGQVFDFALKGFDAYAGYDIARRYAKNDGRRR